MQFYVIEPEVAGGWGENIVADRSVQPVRIIHLHYRFEGWLGDELLTTHPVYICTERVAIALQTAEFTGVRFTDLEISTSSQFRKLYPSRLLPSFRWMQITGHAETEDFGIRQNRLVVSERALDCLRSSPLEHARVTKVSDFQWDPKKHMDDLFAEAKAWADQMRRTREGMK